MADYFAGETISGLRAVAAAPYGYPGTVRIAKAGDPSRMPAIGIVTGNYNSGDDVTPTFGAFSLVIPLVGQVNFGGEANKLLYVGEQGHIVRPGYGVGSGFASVSGVIYQQMGVSLGDPALSGYSEMFRLHTDLTVSLSGSLLG